MKDKNVLIIELQVLLNKHKDFTPTDKTSMLHYPLPGGDEFSKSNWIVFYWNLDLISDLEKTIVILVSDDIDFNKGLELVLNTLFKYKIDVWKENREYVK